jgi:MFS transporter, MHS family, shikimate and dehydroshikimate transport protein
VTIGIIYPAIFSAMSAWFGEQFPTKVRYTAVGLVYQISGMIYSAWTPIIATLLLTDLLPRGWFLYFGYIVSGVSPGLVCAFLLKDRGRRGTGDVVED